jgi:hypothetical protein
MSTNSDTRLTALAKTGPDGRIIWNEYDCKHCKEAGIEHTIRDVPHGVTDKHSDWGEGIPTTRRECSHCKRWDGPWVSAEIVGGGW